MLETGLFHWQVFYETNNPYAHLSFQFRLTSVFPSKCKTTYIFKIKNCLCLHLQYALFCALCEWGDRQTLFFGELQVSHMRLERLELHVLNIMFSVFWVWICWLVVYIIWWYCVALWIWLKTLDVAFTVSRMCLSNYENWFKALFFEKSVFLMD